MYKAIGKEWEMALKYSSKRRKTNCTLTDYFDHVRRGGKAMFNINMREKEGMKVYYFYCKGTYS